MPWYRKLHWQIIIGLLVGVVYGSIAAAKGWGGFTQDWIQPFGTVFLNGLKLIAVPLVLSSLITGVASLGDLKKLSRIGGKTIGIYLGTTVVAVTIGLVLVNTMRPGDRVPEEMRLKLAQTYATQTADREAAAEVTKERGPLELLIDIVPENAFCPPCPLIFL